MSPTTVRLEHVDSIPLAVIRGRVNNTDLRRVVPEWCGVVWNAVRAQQSKGGRHVAIYWDGAIRLEVGVELLGPFDDAGDVVRSATPSGTVATLTHLGPYGGLNAANVAITEWCKANGHHLAGPSWEIYGHWQPEWNADPSRIRTDVFWLLSEAAS
jgi:effector-binding domain-containing protein